MGVSELTFDSELFSDFRAEKIDDCNHCYHRLQRSTRKIKPANSIPERQLPGARVQPRHRQPRSHPRLLAPHQVVNVCLLVLIELCSATGG
jgi:hypothetical protein